MKKILGILLALALLLGMGAVGAGALSLPQPKFELPAYTGILDIPGLPQLGDPAFSSSFFAAAQALTDEESQEVLRQWEELYWKIWSGNLLRTILMNYTAPALMMVVSYDPALYLKDGVSIKELEKAYYQVLEEANATYNPGVNASVAFWGAYMAFFGISSIPNPGNAGYDRLLEAMRTALTDGSLQAALEDAMDAYFLEERAKYAYVNAALAALIKPGALAYAEKLCELVSLYYSFYIDLMMLDPDSLIDEEAEALQAVLEAINDIISDTLRSATIDALLEAGDWAGATALISEAVEAAAEILEAVVFPPPATYTLTYDLLGGASGPDPRIVTGIAKNSNYTLSTAAPSKAGFTFGGWAAASSGTEPITSVTMDRNRTVYAIWTPIPTFTLTYNANNGTGGPATQTGIAANTEVTLATTNLPTRAGYTFKGWAAATTGAAPIAALTVNGNTTVYAVWEKNPDPPAPKFWDNWPPFLQWILQYVLFGWLWMRWF